MKEMRTCVGVGVCEREMTRERKLGRVGVGEC